MKPKPNPRPKAPLDSRLAMLLTLKMAYQFVLDLHTAEGEKRLTSAQEKELGRRLAQYWSMEEA